MHLVQIVKKLAVKAAFSAAWMTNVGNEYGQVLMSVMTASEGSGLTDMTIALVDRYKNAGVPPPDLVYTDRDCCGARGIKALFPDWDVVCVRLDIWHFMRRLAIGVTTESHPLYATFMGRISKCIFEWSAEDFSLLKQAKAKELGVQDDHPLVISSLRRKEMSLHCRRKTRGAEETRVLLRELLDTFCGEQGKDTLGVPLLDTEKTMEMWEAQEKHVECIQDPPNVQLYTKTGTLVKGL